MFIISNTVIYLLGLSVILLHILGAVKLYSTVSFILIISYIIMSQVIACIYLIISGVKLVMAIRKYTTLNPKKLLWSIYIILIMLLLIIPIFSIYWGIHAISKDDENSGVL